MSPVVRVVAIADTHNLHRALEMPPGDLLLVAGDMTMGGSARELAAFDEWLAGLPYKKVVAIAGNHDFLFERDGEKARALLAHAEYLEDSGTEAFGLKLWGSPFTPQFFDWAFMLPRGAALAAKWSRMPERLDLLLTHGPPVGILDETSRGPAGCEALREAVEAKSPRYHVFGHIHEGAGRLRCGPTEFVNASSVDDSYQPGPEPVVLDIPVAAAPGGQPR